MLLHSRQSLYRNLIGPVREINILTWLRSFQKQTSIFGVFFLVYKSPLGNEGQKKTHFVLKGFEPCWKFDNHIERRL